MKMIWVLVGLQKGGSNPSNHNLNKSGVKKIHVLDEGKAEMDYCFTKMMNGEKVSLIDKDALDKNRLLKGE